MATQVVRVCVDRVHVVAGFTCRPLCGCGGTLFPIANGVVCTRDDLRDRGDRLLALRAWKSSLSATQQQRADLDRARRSGAVSGEHVASHMDAGAAYLLDCRDSSHPALA